MDVSRVTLGDKISVGSALLLLATLLLLPWHQVFSFSIPAVDSPGGGWGQLAALLVIAIVVTTVLRRFTATAFSSLPVPIGLANLAASGAVVALLVLKLALDPTFLGFGAFLAIGLAGAMAAGAFLGKDETDEAPPVGSDPSRPPTPF